VIFFERVQQGRPLLWYYILKYIEQTQTILFVPSGWLKTETFAVLLRMSEVKYIHHLQEIMKKEKYSCATT
jgi:hypothetical protein